MKLFKEVKTDGGRRIFYRENPDDPSELLIEPPLSNNEVEEYKSWARANYKPGSPIKGIWHPVIQEECVSMNKEAL